MAAARAMRPALHAATYETLIGLLVVSGLRVGEAIALGRDDVDHDDGLLTVRTGKFGKARLVPLHPSTIIALHGYARFRDTHWPTGRTFFVSTVGTPLYYNQVRVVFARLARQAGLTARGRCRPRLHDFRHKVDGWVMRPAVGFQLVGAAPVVSVSA